MEAATQCIKGSLNKVRGRPPTASGSRPTVTADRQPSVWSAGGCPWSSTSGAYSISHPITENRRMSFGFYSGKCFYFVGQMLLLCGFSAHLCVIMIFSVETLFQEHPNDTSCILPKSNITTSQQIFRIAGTESEFQKSASSSIALQDPTPSPSPPYRFDFEGRKKQESHCYVKSHSPLWRLGILFSSTPTSPQKKLNDLYDGEGGCSGNDHGLRHEHRHRKPAPVARILLGRVLLFCGEREMQPRRSGSPGRHEERDNTFLRVHFRKFLLNAWEHPDDWIQCGGAVPGFCRIDALLRAGGGYTLEDYSEFVAQELYLELRPPPQLWVLPPCRPACTADPRASVGQAARFFFAMERREANKQTSTAYPRQSRSWNMLRLPSRARNCRSVCATRFLALRTLSFRVRRSARGRRRANDALSYSPLKPSSKRVPTILRAYCRNPYLQHPNKFFGLRARNKNSKNPSLIVLHCTPPKSRKKSRTLHPQALLTGSISKKKTRIALALLREITLSPVATWHRILLDTNLATEKTRLLVLRVHLVQTGVREGDTRIWW